MSRPFVKWPPIRRHLLAPARRQSSIDSRPLGTGFSYSHWKNFFATALKPPLGSTVSQSASAMACRSAAACVGGRARVSGCPGLKNSLGTVLISLLRSRHVCTIAAALSRRPAVVDGSVGQEGVVAGDLRDPHITLGGLRSVVGQDAVDLTPALRPQPSGRSRC